MADAPWRCSECGTVNEPVANACRTCGRWPSLFDLEASTIEPGVQMHDEEPMPAPVAVEELETVEPETFEVEEPNDSASAAPARSGRRNLTSILVSLGIVIYLVVSILVNR